MPKPMPGISSWIALTAICALLAFVAQTTTSSRAANAASAENSPPRSASCSDDETGQQQERCCTWSKDLSTGQGNVVAYYVGQVTTSADPFWKLNNGNAYMITDLGSLSGTWMTMAPARWIQQTNYPRPAGASPGTYKFTIKFDVPNCPGSRVRLTGSFAADNNAKAYLDGTPIPGAACSGPLCFKSTDAPISLNNAPVIPAGPHTLQIDVGNSGSAPSYCGLIVNAKLTRTCP